ncbi:MAG: pyridoxamine 5'-phosphate oxidase family protein [Nakamurella sp.]
MSTPKSLGPAESVWLTTLSADGSPHTTPVWFVAGGESIWVATSAAAQKVRNLARDPRLSLAVDGSASRPQVASGRSAERACEEHPDIIAAFAAKYRGWDAADPTHYGPRVLLEIQVDRWLLGGPG